MLTSILVLLIAISASIHIRAEYRGQRQIMYIFKSLTMVLIWLIAIIGHTASPFYKSMIIVGLVFSTVGDIILVMPSDRFLAGMGAFLVAHLFYIVAFASEIRTLVGWPLIPLVVYSFIIYTLLAPSLGELKLPLFIYNMVILIMAWLAWERWIQMGQNGPLLAAIGAVLFIISDTILAINRFRKPFKPACALNLISYFSAQCLLAGSVGALAFWSVTGQ